jgi:G3E family GTPase
LHRALALRNPSAERASFPDTEEGAAALVPWLLETRGGPRTARPTPRAPHGHGQLVAVAFVEDQPLLGEPLLEIVERLGPALVRAKGFVSLAGESRRGFLERAGARTSLRLAEPWPEGPRRTELVLIGEGLDAAALRRQLWACRAARA